MKGLDNRLMGLIYRLLSVLPSRPGGPTPDYRPLSGSEMAGVLTHPPRLSWSVWGALTSHQYELALSPLVPIC